MRQYEVMRKLNILTFAFGFAAFFGSGGALSLTRMKLPFFRGAFFFLC